MDQDDQARCARCGTGEGLTLLAPGLWCCDRCAVAVLDVIDRSRQQPD